MIIPELSRTALFHVWDITAAAATITLAVLISTTYWTCCCQIELSLRSTKALLTYVAIKSQCLPNYQLYIYLDTDIDLLDIFSYFILLELAHFFLACHCIFRSWLFHNIYSEPWSKKRVVASQEKVLKQYGIQSGGKEFSWIASCGRDSIL